MKTAKQVTFKVYRLDRPDDREYEFNHGLDRTFVAEYSSEVQASIHARRLYQNGVYGVQVIDSNGNESNEWCKPKYAEAK